jgi:O-antigen/teichoic acid export membrane protein
MGIVKKQAYKNTAVSYAGMVVAYVNTILLFPFFTKNEEYGLYNLLIGLSVLYSLVASLGIPQIMSKYFPFYRTPDKKHNGFIHWTAIFSLVGFAITTLLFVLLRSTIVHAYIRSSSLLVQYYYYLVPLALFTVFFNFLEMAGRVIYRTIFSSFLRDVLVRLITTVLLGMIAFHWIDFKQFIFLYIASWGLICVILFINLLLSGEFSYRIDDLKFTAIKKAELVNYGLITVVSVSVYVLLQKVDIIMLSSIVGDAKQGVYSWYFNIAIVISVPASALSRTTYQIVSDAWKAKDMKNIADVYNKTSIVQMLVGCLLFVGIICNQNNLLSIVHDPEKIAEFDIFIVIGLGFLVDITGGLNTYIVTTSHKYRLVTVWVICASLLCIGLNYFLIPVYGGMGAAIAYLVTMAALNFCTWYYIKTRFKMQPFTVKHLIVIGITVLGYILGKYLWRMPNTYVDIVVRSGIITAFYGAMIYAFNIAPDINEKVDKTLVKLKMKL